MNLFMTKKEKLAKKEELSKQLSQLPEEADYSQNEEYAKLKEDIAALRTERIAALAAPSENVTVFNTKGFAANEIVSLGDVRAAALTDESGRAYPVQQTEKGAVAYLPMLPSKGWRTYATLEKAAEAPCRFTLTDSNTKLK